MKIFDGGDFLFTNKVFYIIKAHMNIAHFRKCLTGFPTEDVILVFEILLGHTFEP